MPSIDQKICNGATKIMDSIGTAEMERGVQKQVLTAAKKLHSMEQESGVEASTNEGDMKEYVGLW